MSRAYAASVSLHKDFVLEEPAPYLAGPAKWAGRIPRGGAASAVTSCEDSWEAEQLKETRTTQEARRVLLISELGWTAEEAMETRARLKTFEQDWEAPGMEAYDEL